MKRLLILIFMVFICAINPVIADSNKNNQPFSKTMISLKGSANIMENDFHDYWEPGIGGGFQLEMPFYLGQVLMGYKRMSFTGDNILQPDFESAFTYFGVGMEFSVVQDIYLFAGGGFGNLKMTGDPSVLQGPLGEEEVFEETEFAYTAQGELRYFLTEKISFHAGIDHTIVHTRKKIHMTNINAGLGYTFDTPNWLIGVLQ